MTNYTKRYKKLSMFWGILSWVLCFGVGVFLIVYTLATKDSPPTNTDAPTINEVKTVLGTALWGFIISFLPMILLAVIVKDKIKPLIWVANLIMANLIANWLMYIIFAFYLIENYVATPLKVSYKQKLTIHKELDKRV